MPEVCCVSVFIFISALTPYEGHRLLDCAEFKIWDKCSRRVNDTFLVICFIDGCA